MASVSIDHVSKQFGSYEALKDVSVGIDEGEFVVLVGPSGCGKSTLLRLIAGLEEVSSGEILIDDKQINDIAPAKREVAMVFQSYALYPHKTVAQNIGFPLKMSRIPRGEADEMTREAARILQLEDMMDRKPRELSGGQRQRVAIGRAIVRKPKVFLFDEPLSNLDAALRMEMRVELSRLHGEIGATMIYVTHDQVEAMTMADKIVVMNRGRVEQIGRPLDLYYAPETLFVAGFIGSPRMNIFDGTVTEVNPETVSVRIGTTEVGDIPAVPPRDLAAGDKVSLGIRPEHLREDEDGSVLRGIVRTTEALGGETIIHADGDDGRFIVKLPRDAQLNYGTEFRAHIPAETCHLFDSDGRAFGRAATGEPNKFQDRKE